MPNSPRFLAILPLLLLAPAERARSADLHVSADFEGGSAKVLSVDQTARLVRIMPAGDPQRGWPCWWYARIDGIEKDERITVSVAPSDRPARNNGEDTGKPLAASWAMPLRASVSADGLAWRPTPPGRRDGGEIRYEIIGSGSPVWIAWGPPFTPRDTDALIAAAEARLPEAKGFELARTIEGRPVNALRIAGGEGRRGVWFVARQHAWESGASWVAKGLTEWLTSDAPEARLLREQAEIIVVPIADVDNVATGNGGKEAAPRDHNRDWADQPAHPEIAAMQARLKEWAAQGRLDVFVDLHNPAPGDQQPFFFAGPPELLSETARSNRSALVERVEARMTDPLPLDPKVRITGPGYHPLWRQLSAQWVSANGNAHSVAICLETAWNTPNSTAEGYLTVGRQLGEAVADYLRAVPAGEAR